MRANHPAYRNPDGAVYVSRHEHTALLKDPGLRDAPEDDAHSYTLRTINQALIKAVPPRHTELRRAAAAAAFDRGLLAATTGTLTETAACLAGSLADAAGRDGSADLHGGFSLPFTQRAAAIAFGTLGDDFTMLAALPARMFKALYPKAAGGTRPMPTTPRAPCSCT